MIVGALGRIPVGALTDRYGGRVMFPVVSFATIVPVLFLGLAGYRSLTMLLVGGFFLGLAGTSFVVGVPFVNAWFPAERRGMAIGVFGMGMGGTAISALTTVKLTAHWGIHAPFLVVAGALAVYGAAAALVLRDAPGRPVPSQPALTRLAATLRLSITWQAAALYAVGFGGFVAFSVYLPTYLKNAYLLTPADALGSGAMPETDLETTLRDHVGRQIGKLARPSRIIWADDLPKTRSGKIMRRLLRDIAEDREPGDVTTLRDPSVLAQLERNARAGRWGTLDDPPVRD